MRPITLSSYEPLSLDQMMRSVILEFIIFYLLFWWVMSILTKDNWIPNKLENIGNWFKKNSLLSNLFLGVSECKFCLENHVASLMAVGYFFYLYNPSYPIDYYYLIWGFMCASINSWLREFFK